MAAPDAEIYQSQPGLAAISAPGAGEFGDTLAGMPTRNPAELRRHEPDHPRIRKKKVVIARFIHNDRLIDALMAWAFSALNASPGARAYYDQLRTKGIEHNDALRRVANRLVGILHGCLKTRTLYDEATAWGHREISVNLASRLDI